MANFVDITGGAPVPPSGAAYLTTKGDLLTFSTVTTRLGVGTNGQVLTADSTAATGLRWAAAAGGGAPTDAKYWVSESNGTLSAETNLGALTSGLLKHTVSGGVSTPATAVAGTDYVAPARAVNTSGGLQGGGTLASDLTLSIADLGVATGKLADNAVTNAKFRQSTGLCVIGVAANTTGNVADIAAVASSNAVLRESGSGTIGWGTVATGGIANNAVTNAKLRQSSGLTVIGRAGNTVGDVADIAAGSDGHVLRRSSSVLGFGTLEAGAFVGTQTNGFVLTLSGGVPTWTAASGGVTDHGALTGLSDDDHTQYALLAGRSGGQILTGGTASGNHLDLFSTSHPTKGRVRIGGSTGIVYEETNGWVGVGAAPGTGWGEKHIFQLKVNQTGRTYIFSENDNFGGAGSFMCAANSGGQIRIVASGGGIGGSFLGRTLAGNLSQEISNGNFSLGTTSAHEIAIGTNGTERITLTSNGNLAFRASGTPAYGSGVGVIWLGNATTAPSADPTGGVLQYVDSADGRLKVRDTFGVITVLT